MHIPLADTHAQNNKTFLVFLSEKMAGSGFLACMKSRVPGENTGKTQAELRTEPGGVRDWGGGDGVRGTPDVSRVRQPLG